MIFKKIIITCFFVFLITLAHAQEQNTVKRDSQESDQQIGGFSLAGYGEKGQKNWDLAGNSADIFTDVVKLKDVIGNLYGKEEDIHLTAERGDFNKTDGKVHLEKDVVITTSSGTKMTTESLDWDRKGQSVSTEEIVNIQKENMTTVARGAHGDPNLKRVELKKDVRVDINPPEEQKVIITCDGPLEIDYAKNTATFINNVKVDRGDTIIYSDKMDIYFLSGPGAEERPETEAKEKKGPAFMGATKIDKIVARGHVRVIRGENVSYSEEAVYSSLDKKLILTGRPQLIITSMEDFQNASFGN